MHCYTALVPAAICSTASPTCPNSYSMRARWKHVARSQVLVRHLLYAAIKIHSLDRLQPSSVAVTHSYKLTGPASIPAKSKWLLGCSVSLYGSKGFLKVLHCTLKLWVCWVAGPFVACRRPCSVGHIKNELLESPCVFSLLAP